MDVVVLVGRILFSALFFVSALGHFGQSGAMTGYAQSRGVPFARPAVLLGGVLLALGALSILLGCGRTSEPCCSLPSWSRRPC
jgi:putative oxidoreductase